MKPLSEMTREELWELDIFGLLCVAKQEGVKSWRGGFPEHLEDVAEGLLERLDTLRLELQQDKAAK